MTISRPKILSIALIISLAVNVIIGGFVTAQWIDRGWEKQRHGGYHFDRRAAVAVLDETQKEKLQKIWKAQRDVIRPYFREFGQARQKLADLFGAPTLDLTAVNETYSNMVATQMQIENLLQASLLEMAKALPDDQRAAFFKEGFRPPKKHPKPDREKPE
ncbi:MAG: periplasmic heavy metal sensor [Sneathiella sp.]|nr:periplasmic heavy metal sensor [Sneathiella sp.]